MFIQDPTTLCQFIESLISIVRTYDVDRSLSISWRSAKFCCYVVIPSSLMMVFAIKHGNSGGKILSMKIKLGGLRNRSTHGITSLKLMTYLKTVVEFSADMM